MRIRMVSFWFAKAVAVLKFLANNPLSPNMLDWLITKRNPDSISFPIILNIVESWTNNFSIKNWIRIMNYQKFWYCENQENQLIILWFICLSLNLNKGSKSTNLFFLSVTTFSSKLLYFTSNLLVNVVTLGDTYFYSPKIIFPTFNQN